MAESHSHNPFLAKAAPPPAKTGHSAMDDLLGLDLTTPMPATAPAPAAPDAFGSSHHTMTDSYTPFSSSNLPGGFGDARPVNQAWSQSVGSPVSTSSPQHHHNPFLDTSARSPAPTSANPYAASEPMPELGTTTHTGASPSMASSTQPLSYMSPSTASTTTSTTTTHVPTTSTYSTVTPVESNVPSTVPAHTGLSYAKPAALGATTGAALAPPSHAGATKAQEQAQIDADAQLAQSLASANVHDDTQWALKDIVWRGTETKIIMQNENGPCSLIALCNLLLLEKQLHITPPDRPAVSYAYLSDLLTDYIMECSNGALDPSALSLVLSTLPKMLKGFQVDVFFDAPDKFGSDTGAASSGELTLFRVARVPLLHGWIADPTDSSTYAALTQVGSYNNATMLLSQNMAGMNTGSLPQLVRTFLEQYKTQLTPAGVVALKRILAPGQLAVLFRNSHLSVLYHRRADEGSMSTPSLFTLVSDSIFLMEDKIVWESLEDTTGQETRYFDGQFQQVIRSEAEWARMVDQSNVANSTESDDYALALRLQNEERQRAAARRARRGHTASPLVNVPDSSSLARFQTEPSSSQTSSSNGRVPGMNGIKKMMSKLRPNAGK
ncbi:K48-linked deubiquitinase [Malassezia pachydermatis]|uniref:MINDY deubiquitinase domain-containing protein n=1 Tax=Malassezia pachydermatis TaxID=77020 RepID=A0A0M8MWI7_9BASI|nr:hypothetical protein Malapachy_2253 [Malassezia pachydermatis]KOS15190.1 hypothetical protein Malapachy_2253 [Malassezia pachydermatis]